MIFILINSPGGCFALIFEDVSQNQPGLRVASLWKRVIQSNLPEEQTIPGTDTEAEPTIESASSSSEKMMNLAKRRWDLARATGEKQMFFVDKMNEAKVRRKRKDMETQTDLLGRTSYSSTDLRATTGLSFLLECLRNLSFKKPVYSDICYKIAMIIIIMLALPFALRATVKLRGVNERTLMKFH